MVVNDIIRKMEGHKPSNMEIRKEHAVLLPLIETEEGLSFVFEKRAANIIQGGEVCFPGGAIEPGETPKQAAIREFTEELGVGEEVFQQFVGQFDTLVTYGQLNIYTFVAILKQGALEHLAINPDEVSRVFTIPVKFLEENEPKVFEFPLKVELTDESFFDIMELKEKAYKWRKGTLVVPVWKYDGEILWGMTARMVRAFLKFINE